MTTRLPVDTKPLLLTAAVEPVGDVTVLCRAVERLGSGPDAADPAGAAGLIEPVARDHGRFVGFVTVRWDGLDARGARDATPGRSRRARLRSDATPRRAAPHRRCSPVGAHRQPTVQLVLGVVELEAYGRRPLEHDTYVADPRTIVAPPASAASARA